MSSLTRFIIVAVSVTSLFIAGCSDSDTVDDNENDDTHLSDRCPDQACVFCEDDDDCDDATYCDEDQGETVCVMTECQPHESHCEDGKVVRCNSRGSGYLDALACEDGVCLDGECGCQSVDDCAVGEDCVDNQCSCPSEVHCGDAGRCCDEGEVCAESEVCENGDECTIVHSCRPECQGSVCGVQGELCCEGDTPNCGPTGHCAPNCEGEGELCGADFDICCPAGDLCVFGECQTPGESCEIFSDCDFGEYCDDGLGKCMPDDFPDDIECSEEGEFEEMEIVEKWSWTDEDIISIPVVGDVTGNGEPNVVINTTRDGGGWTSGRIVIIDAQGDEIRRIDHDPQQDSWGSMGRSNIALADVTGDGVMDIIYASRQVNGSQSYIVAIDGEGQKIWRARDDHGDLVTVTVQNGAITVADFDGDPSRAEVVVGAMLIDSDGRVVWNEDGNGPTLGSNSGYTGGVATVADLTDDGTYEIVTGRQAWTVDWQNATDPDDPPEVTVTSLWEHDGPDGYSAVADITGNGDPEVVLVAAQTVRVLEGTTGKLVCGIDPTGQQCEDDDSLRTAPAPLPGPSSNNRGGPPTVADFDGDDRPEIGVAGGHYYAVFDIFRPRFGDDNTPEEIDPDLLDEFNQPQPNPGEIFVRWARETQDLSSNATGSSVFDFQGDGSASVIYSDECFMRVYSGLDGEVELEIMNSTGTILEYPLVVDVDKNGRSEILVVSNATDHCSELYNDYETRRGIFVYEDPNDRWVRTRSIWNQHAYSIDNILDDGSVPELAQPWWQTHNTFRANRQGEVPLNAADISVESVQTNALSCPPDIDFQITVQNVGISAIPAGLPVSLYHVDKDERITTLTVDAPIAPGSTVVLDTSYSVPSDEYNTPLNFLVVANDDGSGESVVYDCDPDKASALIDPVECRIEL